ncbi:nuclear transport factor 2 family protein [Rathayibacter sp. Leaf248]|uniref:nuclear transport factor 2 family protein n=1 Tax=Rathayibacter sp. Leaf248 TaxID=2876555 RepID=UPI001E48F76C|nr:nuclear transport factor 2 family protein [Rathayibacter sp. Leaf248]
MDETLETLIDRVAIRELVDTYARGADRRDAVLEASVFADDGEVLLFSGDPETTEPVDTIRGRDALVRTFEGLIAQYDATTYLNGQSSVRFVTADAAEGETYCTALHLLRDAGQRYLLTMSIRYLDRFERIDGRWRIAQRRLVIDWTDRSASAP